jgi:hypothetical protein
MGLPVTTPLTACLKSWPTVFMYVSMAHAMVLALVPMSGAGMSVSGPMLLPEGVDEAARDALELRLRDAVRVKLDAALSAAERQAHEGALPRHHGREGLEVVEADGLVVADAALVRAEEVVVLDAVALEEPV